MSVVAETPATEMDANILYAAFICCAQVCNTKEILLCSRGNADCLCVKAQCCCNQVDQQMRVGCITDPDFIVLCGLPCCEYGLHPFVCNIQKEAKCLCFEMHAQVCLYVSRAAGLMSSIVLPVSLSLLIGQSLIILFPLIFYQPQQFPFGDVIEGPTCAYCFLSCMPKVGCCQSGPVYKTPEMKAAEKEKAAGVSPAPPAPAAPQV